MRYVHKQSTYTSVCVDNYQTHYVSMIFQIVKFIFSIISIYILIIGQSQVITNQYKSELKSKLTQRLGKTCWMSKKLYGW